VHTLEDFLDLKSRNSATDYGINVFHISLTKPLALPSWLPLPQLATSKE